MLLLKKHVLIIILFTFLPIQNLLFAQVDKTSYEKLLEKIENNEITNTEKIKYIDQYIVKAQRDNNLLEKFKALNYKTYLVPYDQGEKLFGEILPIVNQIDNDSIKSAFINRKAIFYYKNRQFKKALENAIDAENISEKSKNLYTLYSVRIDIGNIYYHTLNYEKALHYFNLSKDYFKDKNTINDQISYIVSLYSLGKTYWSLANVKELKATIKESEEAIKKLDPKYQEFEIAYLNYIKGGAFYLKGDFENAKKHFEKSLDHLIENEDFTNEHIIYLYLGKIAWEQNKRELAISYFNKIDNLFTKKSFLNYELREAYEYLITYYKETNQPRLQLEATENLLLLNKQFEKEQLTITHTLHKELDTKKLETTKLELQKQISNNKKWYFILGIGFILLAIYSYWLRNERKNLKGKFDELIQKIEKDKTIPVLKNDYSNSKNDIKLLEKDTIDSNSTELKILKLLEIFEVEKGYLEPLKLEDLATKLGTNRTTLSTILNEHKGNFLVYINGLRIQQLLSDLTIDIELRKKTISEISELYGFINEKTFSTHFKKITGLTPSYFIKQLDTDLLN